jgi:hypothetical protein
MRGHPRTPLAKAKATGRTVNNPGRFKDRKEHPSRPLGKPSTHLKGTALECWESFKREVTWLMERDRTIVETASLARASLIDNGYDAKVASQLLSCLSRMGATPADATRVHVTKDEEADVAGPPMRR